jgi:hypothetical protein
MGRNNTAASGISHDPSVIVPSTSVKIAPDGRTSARTSDSLPKGLVFARRPKFDAGAKL